ncbi:GntR family transcriptional regulator [Rhizobium oryzicola]|uniref:GntR family transcriptional regulator n=1 Tax=Rhizobium oryzicola TaxID=1232668 RepID=A0ABT8T4H1_9HYPH|nr:GntR family transcriptional regulator [Rhizobium oryzicola]MDO1585496.1 GntR family transcriptional regulator [Rhizobium oryzicola]
MSETVAQRIANVIGERIVRGEIQAGTPLRQDTIAREFDASHVPAREALQHLRSQGLAISLPRRGMRVAPLDQTSILETIEIRAALETLALRLAAPKINSATMEKIELAMVAGDEAESIVEWERANRSFHRELVGACRMPKLLSMLDDLQLANSRILFSATRSAGWRPGSSAAHHQIFEALKRKEISVATSLLDAHIRGLERASLDGRVSLKSIRSTTRTKAVR